MEIIDITAQEYIELASKEPKNRLKFISETPVDENNNFTIIWEDSKGQQYRTTQSLF